MSDPVDMKARQLAKEYADKLYDFHKDVNTAAYNGYHAGFTYWYAEVVHLRGIIENAKKKPAPLPVPKGIPLPPGFTV